MIMCVFACQKAGDSDPLPHARQGLADDGQLRPVQGDRCPVCAMHIVEHPKTAAALVLDNGATYYFCGNGCMIRTWLHPEVFLRVERARIARTVVQDYFTGAPIDAMDAYWIAGSDVVGPMGPALVPLKDEASVEAFKGRHGGRIEFRLREVDDARWEEITGRKAVPASR
jgi:nitrous oxide reductase accessory protein NosL